jgi:hypothetical protein
MGVDYSVEVIDWRKYIAHLVEFPDDDLDRETYTFVSEGGFFANEGAYLTDDNHGCGMECFELYDSVRHHLPSPQRLALERFFGSLMPDWFHPDFPTTHQDWPPADRERLTAALHPNEVKELFVVWNQIDIDKLRTQLSMYDNWPTCYFASPDDVIQYMQSWSRIVELGVNKQAGITVLVC